MTDSRPAVLLREVPAVIYLALGINLFGTFVHLIATIASGTTEYSSESYEALVRWQVLDGTCWNAFVILLPLGFIELAKRCRGSARTLGLVAAALMFGSAGWMVFDVFLNLIHPSADISAYFDWFGRGLGLLTLVAIILLTIAADAWRRVPLAAVGVLLLICTASWVPVLGHAISDAIGHNPALRLAYGFVRDSISSVGYLFIAAAFAAQGRIVPEPQRAVSGFRLARGAMLFRFYAAIAIAFAMFGALRSETAGTLVLLGGPLVIVGTMLLMVIGLVRAAASNIEGLPRWRFAIGATAMLWWTALQISLLTQLLSTLRDHDTIKHADMFSIAGPIVATLGLAFVGSGIAAFASGRGERAMASSLTARTVTFAGVSLGAIAVQSFASTMTTGSALAWWVLSLVAGIVSLIVLAGVLRDGANLVENVPGLPPARVV